MESLINVSGGCDASEKKSLCRQELVAITYTAPEKVAEIDFNSWPTWPFVFAMGNT